MTKKIEGSRAGKTAGALVPVKTAKQALAVPDTANEAIVREKGVTLVVAQPYAMRDRTIVPDQAFYVKDVKSKAEGPWLHEADKLAWRDETTGYECIILRSDAGGHLCGYVGIPPSHPLYGVKHQAIPEDLDIEVHGGLSYSRVCESGPSPRPTRLAVEARRICHVICNVPVHRPRELRHATTYRVEDGDAWWLGFSCDKRYDLVPDLKTKRYLSSEIGPVYRDDAYVYGQVVDLAAQLRAIADGDPKPARTSEAPPPLGLDPEEGG